jgi:hypothetical protein
MFPVKIILLTAAAALLAMAVVRAQDAADVAPAPDATSGIDGTGQPATVPQITPPTTPDEAAALDKTLYGEEDSATDAGAGPEAQSRPWKMNFHASAGTYYDDNILISSTGREWDSISTLTGGGGLTLGDYTARQDNYLIADYTGIGELFGRHTNEDAYEQKALLESQVRIAHLTLSGSFQFQDLADELIDIGTLARQRTYVGDFSARYDLNEKTYLAASAEITVADYDLYLDSNDERGGLSLNYLPDPGVTIGLGAMGGILNVEDSGSQTYEQLLASLRADVSAKFTFKAAGGVEDRQLEDGGSLVTPVFELTGDYKPFDGLDLSLTGYRRVLNSAYYSGYDYIATGVSVGIQYAFSPTLTALFEGGYENFTYRETSTGASISRADNYCYVKPALRYAGAHWWDIELYYLYRTDNSTLSASSFNDTQAGAALDLNF